MVTLVLQAQETQTGARGSLKVTRSVPDSEGWAHERSAITDVGNGMVSASVSPKRMTNSDLASKIPHFFPHQRLTFS